MEKIKLEISPVEWEEVKLSKDTKIFVNPYIDISKYITIANLYLDTYFNSTFTQIVMPNYNYFSAEQTFKFAIVDLCTNVELSSLDFDLFESNGYMNKVIEKIVNYNEIKNNIKEMVDIVEKQKNFEKKVELIKEQFYTTFNDVFSSFNVEKLQKDLENVLKEVENSPLSAAFAESKKTVKKSKSRVTKVGE